jgi:hypothetical protein
MPTEFCPRCASARTGSFRYCRNCAFDYEAGESDQPVDSRALDTVAPLPTGGPSGPNGFGLPREEISPPQATPLDGTGIAGEKAVTAEIAVPRIHSRTWLTKRKAAISGVAVVLALGAIGSLSRGKDPGSVTAVSTSSLTSRATLEPPTPSPTWWTRASAPTIEGTPEPTTPPEQTGPKTFSVGYKVTLTSDTDDQWAYVTIDKVSQHKTYGSGYLVDKPKKGNIFIQARVTYEAIVDGVDYNPYDWQVFVDGTAVENTSFVYSGPDPSLSSGSLPAGRKASGWVIYEVPINGEVRMSYGNTYGDTPPVFEVVIRKS